MSDTVKKLFPKDLQAMKDRGEKIFYACPYDYHSTMLAEAAGADLVGFGGGTHEMMLGGAPNALGASMEDILSLARTIVPAVKRAVILMAMPFGSFQASNEEAARNAVRLVKAGANCVKAQVDIPLLDRAKAIIDTGIPFQGHVGLMPQYYNQRGGMVVYGRTAKDARHLYELSQRLQDLGATALEMECVPARVATVIARKLSIPVLGIGSGVQTDGQIIVLVDVLGLQQTLELKTVKKYANLYPQALEAMKRCVEEVRTGQFPEECHTFAIKDEEFEKFQESIG